MPAKRAGDFSPGRKSGKEVDLNSSPSGAKEIVCFFLFLRGCTGSMSSRRLGQPGPNCLVRGDPTGRMVLFIYPAALLCTCTFRLDSGIKMRGRVSGCAGTGPTIKNRRLDLNAWNSDTGWARFSRSAARADQVPLLGIQREPRSADRSQQKIGVTPLRSCPLGII